MSTLERMQLFGKEILVRSHTCSENGCPCELTQPAVRIYVKVTNACNARCRFCSNWAHSERIGFDAEKFLEIVQAVEESKFNLQRVCLTGGEPSCAEETVLGILEGMVSDDLVDVPVFMSTNGISASARRLMRHPRLNCVTMSLHHYDYGRLGEIYGVGGRIESFEGLGMESRKFTATCNLMKGYVDSAEEAKRMMDFALRIGCSELGFVSLMDKNAFCREAYVDVDDLRLENVDHLIFASRHSGPAGCKCSNYLYVSGDRTLSVYLRDMGKNDSCESILLFDGQYLRQGFDPGDIIY